MIDTDAKCKTCGRPAAIALAFIGKFEKDGAVAYRCSKHIVQWAKGLVDDTMESLERSVKDLRRRKDGAYLERNRLVAAFCRLALELGWNAGKARTAIEGWSEEWHGCIYIDTPSGQVSWHYHDSHDHLFDDLPDYDGKWDGHTTDQKYERLNELLRID